MKAFLCMWLFCVGVVHVGCSYFYELCMYVHVHCVVCVCVCAFAWQMFRDAITAINTVAIMAAPSPTVIEAIIYIVQWKECVNLMLIAI